MREKLYVAVTHDKYELPICVTTSVREMAKLLGRPEGSIYSEISHHLWIKRVVIDDAE